MKKEAFGELVSVLRKDCGFTQAELAEKTHLSRRTIEELERGKLAKLEWDLLAKLALGLDLTNFEREEFFVAAVDVPQTSFSNADYETLVSELENILGNVRLPAFVADHNSDIVLTNNCILHLFDIGTELLAEGQQNKMFNVMYVVFHEHYARIIKNAFHQVVIDNFHRFRKNSLRYRATPRFKEIIGSLNARYGKDFTRYWDFTRGGQDTTSVSSISYRYHHPQYGYLEYHSTITEYVTNKGDLDMTVYVPLSIETAIAFEEIAKQAGNSVLRLVE